MLWDFLKPCWPVLSLRVSNNLCCFWRASSSLKFCFPRVCTEHPRFPHIALALRMSVAAFPGRGQAGSLSPVLYRQSLFCKQREKPALLPVLPNPQPCPGASLHLFCSASRGRSHPAASSLCFLLPAFPLSRMLKPLLFSTTFHQKKGSRVAFVPLTYSKRPRLALRLKFSSDCPAKEDPPALNSLWIISWKKIHNSKCPNGFVLPRIWKPTAEALKHSSWEVTKTWASL